MAGTLTPTGSLAALIQELVEIEKTVDPRLRVYDWQPIEPDLPAIFNWLAPSTFEIRDQMRWRDNVSIIVRIGVWHSDDDMYQLVEFADAFRDVMDDAVYNFRPVGSKAIWAERNGMNMAQLEFNGAPALGIEFPMTFRLDRRIEPNA
jgi:hypothetical protein